MLDRLRKATFTALTSKTGNKLFPVRLGKRAALYLNDMAGRPLADAAELDRRAEFDKNRGQGSEPISPEPLEVPVVLFHSGSTREFREIVELLGSEGIKFDARDLEEDEPSREAVHRESGGLKLPVLFIAGTPIGGLAAVKNLVGSGELQRVISARGEAKKDPGSSDRAELGDSDHAAQVYGDDSCAWTGRVQALLEGNDIAYEYIDLRAPENGLLRDRLERETGHYTQPWVFVRGRFVGGFNALDEHARLGQLQLEAEGTEAPGRTKVVVAERDNTDEIAPAERDEP